MQGDEEGRTILVTEMAIGNLDIYLLNVYLSL